MDVVVQPSVPWMSLNDQIKDSGLFFPVDPGPSVSNAFRRLKTRGSTESGKLVYVNLRPGQDRRYGWHKLQVTTAKL